MPSNPLLAKPMYLGAFIERLGTGTTDRVEKAKKAELQKPEFMQDPNFELFASGNLARSRKIDYGFAG